MAVDFSFGAGAYEYRALKLAQPRLQGWDCYALQTALNSCGATPRLTLDGAFGRKTEDAVSMFQRTGGMVTDGVAGVQTQAKLASKIATRVQRSMGMPHGIPYGHCEHESSLWLGNYTAEYPNGSRDCGVVQRNTQYHPAERGFDVADSIKECGRSVWSYRTRYALINSLTDRRVWELACGSWNAPAFTDALAQGKESVVVGGSTVSLAPGAPARVKIEAYMAAVTAYCRW